MTPDLLRRVGETLYGPAWQRAIAGGLGVNERRVREWLAGDRRPPPGLRAELVRLLRQHAVTADQLADNLVRGIADLHGLTRRELAAIGWLLDSRRMLDGGDWLRPMAQPAETLLRQVRVAMDEAAAAGIMQMDDGESGRLLAALARLTDRQALDVLPAAYDVADITCAVIPDD